MKIISYAGEAIEVTQTNEEIKNMLEQQGYADIPYSEKDIAISILRDQGRGYELFSYKADQYIHIMEREAGVALEDF